MNCKAYIEPQEESEIFKSLRGKEAIIEAIYENKVIKVNKQLATYGEKDDVN